MTTVTETVVVSLQDAKCHGLLAATGKKQRHYWGNGSVCRMFAGKPEAPSLVSRVQVRKPRVLWCPLAVPARGRSRLMRETVSKVACPLLPMILSRAWL